MECGASFFWPHEGQCCGVVIGGVVIFCLWIPICGVVLLSGLFLEFYRGFTIFSGFFSVTGGMAFSGASSPLTLTWMRSGGPPMPEDHSIRAGTLYINAAQQEAEGVYTCLGIGGSGVVLSRANATLRVLGE